MLFDALLSFVPLNGNLSIVAGTGVAVPSTNTIDLLGQGVGTAPANIIGNAALFGEDPGVGGRARPEIVCITGAAFTANVGTPTLNVQLQYAPDTGAAGGYLPGAWQTVAETGGLTIAQLGAAVEICRFPFLPAVPANVARPRFVRLNFQPLTGTSFATGTIAEALVTIVRDDQANKQASRNYTVA